ncbi:hypothetical protein BKA70DRAFT_820989 [Coprinopsis sp. MPI-PUGE-AT-0042]|nr:hypothetical protein BKA70DRAFT_820989 [Coprinopsis sp. MPI-PUGE-AT-0042]
MHNINASTLDWRTQRRSMALFKKLCGTESMQDVVVVTSFWDKLTSVSEGAQKEGYLQTDDGFLKELYVGGARFVRSGHFPPGEQPQDPSFLTPKQVVDHLLSLNPVFVAMQEEMARGAAIAKTDAGFSLLEEFEQLKHKTQVVLEAMRERLVFIWRAEDDSKTRREDLKREAERMWDSLNRLDRDRKNMRMKLIQWENYYTQVCVPSFFSRHFHSTF